MSSGLLKLNKAKTELLVSNFSRLPFPQPSPSQYKAPSSCSSQKLRSCSGFLSSHVSYPIYHQVLWTAATSKRYPETTLRPLHHDHPTAHGIISHMNFNHNFLTDLSESTLALPIIRSLQSGQSGFFLNKNKVQTLQKCWKHNKGTFFVPCHWRVSCQSDASCSRYFSVCSS